MVELGGTQACFRGLAQGLSSIVEVRAGDAIVLRAISSDDGEPPRIDIMTLIVATFAAESWSGGAGW